MATSKQQAELAMAKSHYQTANAAVLMARAEVAVASASVSKAKLELLEKKSALRSAQQTRNTFKAALDVLRPKRKSKNNQLKITDAIE